MINRWILFVILQILHLTSTKCTLDSEQFHQDSFSKIRFCPQWTTVKASDCIQQQFLSITPNSGFGNMLNGVLQGYLIANMLNRCLHIHWRHDELLSTSMNYTSKMKDEVDSGGFGGLGLGEPFPSSARGLKKLIEIHERGAHNLNLDVGFRDRFCTMIRSNRVKLKLGLEKQVLKSLRKHKTLCVFLEGCIFKHFLRPNNELSSAISKVENAWRRIDTISVAIQVRMGDYASIGPSEQNILNTGYDKRIPNHVLDLFWDTAKDQAEKEVHKRGMKFASFFIATDSAIASDDAKKAFQELDVYFTTGKLRHSDLGSVDLDTDLKMLSDWYLISRADIVIQGPWSSYVEKALLNSARKQRIIRCRSLYAGSELNNRRIVKYKGDWGCFASVLQDTLKGPRAVDY